MKTILSYLAVAALIVTSSFTVNQQQQLNQPSADNCFSHFRVHRQGKAGVSVNWNVTSADINRFVVERSYDGEFFDPANSIDFNGSSAYKYLDKGIYPGLIYYRVVAVLSDGTTAYSPVETIRIVQHE
jgi:hypothetical protein